MVNRENLEMFNNQPDGRIAPKNSSFLVYLTAFTGIAFIAFLFGSLFQLPEPPSAFGQGDANQLLRYLTENKQTFLFQTYLRSVAAFLMFLFIGGAISIAYRKLQAFKPAGIFALGGGILFTVLMFISQVTDATAALLANETADPALIRAIFAVGDAMRHFNAFSAALMMGAVSIFLWQARIVPVWQTVFGVFAIPLFLIAAAGFPGTSNEYLNLGALSFLPLFPLTLSMALVIGGRKSSREGIKQS